MSYRGSALVIKASVSLELLVQLATWRVLEHQKHPLAIMKIVVEAKNVGMPEKKGKTINIHLAIKWYFNLQVTRVQ